MATTKRSSTASKQAVKKPIDLMQSAQAPKADQLPPEQKVEEKILGEIPPEKSGITKNGIPQKVIIKEINGRTYNVVGSAATTTNNNQGEQIMADKKNPETENTNTTTNANPEPQPAPAEPTPENPQPKKEPQVTIVRHIHEPKIAQPWDEFGVETAQLAIKAAVIAGVVAGVTFGMAALFGQTEK